ncbi:hypothetical protein [Sphingomonas sp. 10B4]|nr:hypothetical protein [Sphingomonas sp. 10B4]
MTSLLSIAAPVTAQAPAPDPTVQPPLPTSRQRWPGKPAVRGGS